MSGSFSSDSLALVGRTLVLVINGEVDAANLLLHGLSDDELRHYAGSAIETAAALAVQSFGSEERAVAYAEVVMLNAAIESTPEEA